MARNETEVLMPAEIRVQLPPDYMCSVVGDGTADPDGSKGFFTLLARKVDSIEIRESSDLGFQSKCWRQDLNNDGYADSPMATVRSGTWSLRP